MSHKGRLFVIAGPSGAGKGTLVRKLLQRVPFLYLSISATTRGPREGERNGREYYFLSDAEFDKKIEDGEFLEWANIFGKRYGTLRRRVEEQLESGDVILEIDIQGARQIKDNFNGANYIFIKPPSTNELRRRLINRGTESDNEIERRLRIAEEELEAEPEFNYVILNDSLTEAIDNLVDIIIKCRESSKIVNGDKGE